MASSTKKKPDTKRKKTQEDWALLGVVGVSALMILCSLVIALIAGRPIDRAEHELNKIADDYYITYLYPRLLGRLDADPKEVLSKYIDNGVATTYLRQLLHYDSDKNLQSKALFATVACNTNTTWVRYYPTAPFGPRDYRIEYKMNCEE